MTLRKRLIALSMAAACAATAFAGAAFTDQSSIKVDSKVIDTLTEKNVIKGFENGSFKPDTAVTRAQMAKMMFVLRTGLDDASYYAKDMTDTFVDGLTGAQWKENTLKLADAEGLLTCVTTKPDDALPRQYAAQMSYNAISK